MSTNEQQGAPITSVDPYDFAGSTVSQWTYRFSSPFCGDHYRPGFDVGQLFKVVNGLTISAKTKIGLIAARRSAISIGDMFEMQMLMNHLSQVSEMATNVVAAANSAIMSMARNVKG
ncbi:MAG: DUF5407 family protein [Chlamydiota bacterium]